MWLSEWQVRRVEEYVRMGCDPSGPVYGDMLDHLCCLIEERMEHNMTFEDALTDALGMLTNDELKKTEYETLELLSMEATCSKRTAWLALIPYALICMDLFMQLSIFCGLLPAWFERVTTITFIFVSIILIIVYGIVGWWKNFPRWSFAVLGLTLWAIYNIVLSIFFWHNFHMGNRWTLGVISVIILVGILFRFSLEPLREIGRKVKRDPWLILFAFYPLICWFSFRFMDDFNSLWRIPVALAVTVLFSWGFFTFLTNEDRRWRIAGLLVPVVTIPLAAWAIGSL